MLPGASALREASAQLPLDDVEGLAGLALARGLADADDRLEAGGVRPRPWRAPGRRSRHGRRGARSGRRSPVAPASASISAEMSPVKAPALGVAVLAADRDARAEALRSGKARPASPAGRSEIDLASGPGLARLATAWHLERGRRPFIFQFPATSGRGRSGLMGLLRCRQRARLPERRGAAVCSAGATCPEGRFSRAPSSLYRRRKDAAPSGAEPPMLDGMRKAGQSCSARSSSPSCSDS